MKRKRRSNGFTLLELMVAMGMAIVITVAGTILFKKTSDITFMISQRSNIQSDARAAINAVGGDLNLAGAGLQSLGISVPADAVLCVEPTVCKSGGLEFYGDMLYGVMPGYRKGAVTVSGQPGTDGITIAYTDRSSNFSSSCNVDDPAQVPCGYDARLVTVIAGSTPTLEFRDAASSGTVRAPSPPLADPQVGFKVNDLVLISNVHGQAIGVVTGVPDTTHLQLGDDPLKLNEGLSSGSGPIHAIMFENGNATTASVTKLNLVTYYLQVLTGGDGTLGTADDTYRLMRAYGANKAVPVADEISDLRIVYSAIDETLVNPDTKQLPLVGALPAPSPGQIRGITVTVVASGNQPRKGIKTQQIALSTTIAPRALAWFDQYKQDNSGTAAY